MGDPGTGPSASGGLVVFDLDGTLIRGDSFARFVVFLLRRQWPRFAVALVLAPVLLPAMLLPPPVRRFGVAGFVWLATVGRPARELDVLAHRFAGRDYAAPGAPQRREGVIAIARSLVADGERVLVSTGCAEPVASAVCHALGLTGCEVHASELTFRRGGMVPWRSCLGPEKVRRLTAAHGDAVVVLRAYSDSARDLPLLTAARDPHLVAPDRATLRKVRRHLGRSVVVLDG